ATAGTGYLDPKFSYNISEAQRLGIFVGVYHYSYAKTAEEAAAEAKFLLKVISPYKLSFPVAYDIEDACQNALNRQQKTDLICAFCEEIERSGYYAVVYSMLYWFKTAFDAKRLERYDKWVAQWSSKCSCTEPYGMWQYSNKGRISGISTNVDLDIAYKNYPAIIEKMQQRIVRK
ncbi:MAG: GH25 family lysozyme, partial [Oscillospiraceae bacterium]